MIVSLIVAMSENRGIGQRGDIPWHLPSDLKRFKKLTMGHHLIMGRKTWESIGRVLPGRTMVVITRQRDYVAEGCVVVYSLDDALQFAKDAGETEAFVAGGGEIYFQAMPYADRMYISRLEKLIEVDTFFPPIDEEKWRLESIERFEQGEVKIPYSFELWGRG